MTKLVQYDFSIDNLVTVQAPEGTDPETLREEALLKVWNLMKDDCIEVVFEKIVGGSV
ncbi:hypothetical protein [Limnobacter sp.]|uniref:hypothetical protein n=1 Tax=Limnobacter sp. TaxID=2003368 RepID=UPI0025B8DC96|nr:hypothetical protein [Limnobacter sp.]